MKKLIMYTISALVATAFLIFWIMYPEITTQSPYPRIATAYLIAGIVLGYVPLVFGILLKSKKAHLKK